MVVDKVVFSIVVPMHNEEENIAPLCREIGETFSGFENDWELILVDDASTDSTRERIKHEIDMNYRIRLVRQAQRRGQSAALCLGFSESRGDYIGTLDGDMQNDPKDLISMFELLQKEKGFDMITGWRRKRCDSLLRRISSRIANWTRNLLTGVTITDVGCSTRVFRRVCLSQLPCYFNGMHRFFPLLFQIVGFVVKEVPVNHRPRKHGTAKYGVGNRLWRGIRDLFGVRWLKDRYLKEGPGVIINSSKKSQGSPK